MGNKDEIRKEHGLTRKRVAWGVVVVAVLAVAALAAHELAWTDAYWLWRSRASFVEYSIPFKATQLLMDIGVVDANGDDWLDIFTTNHNYRQDLLIANGKGGYLDMLSTWRLDQNLEFPGSEITLTAPEIDKPGVYLYWKGRRIFTIRTYKMKEVGRLQARLRSYTTVNHYEGSGFIVEAPVNLARPDSKIADTVMSLSSEADGELDMEIETPGTPLAVDLEGTVPLSSVYIGRQKVSPHSKQFELTFQDRHGMAWADYNDDGLMDVFISRGALSGQLRLLPENVEEGIQDELIVSEGPGRYRNVVREVGIDKRGCSGRKVNWVDFNRDGRLDLFINCQDRGNPYVQGKFPKQLYRQNPDKHFVDVAAEVGLDLPDHEVIDFVWFDADNDGYIDLLTYEDTGFYLYRNHDGKSFTREFIGRGKFARADNPHLKGMTEEYWFADGKLAVADFRGNGRLDVFSSSKTGNTLLLNDGSGKFSMVDPATIGLPGESVTASWVDFDNDGLPDLYAVPQGLFRQRRDHTFEATGLLTLPPHKHMAAIANWADFDNNGRRNLLLASLENFSKWRWWEKLLKNSEDRFAWNLQAYRNLTDNGNHWLEVRLVGKQGNPQAIGARVTLRTGDAQQTQQVGLNDGAFFSQGHYRLYFGLGSQTRADRLEIRWPDGQVQELTSVEGDRLQVIHEEAAK
jgi:ASPIC and UnbV/FG-GAP-like repeat